MDVYSRSSGAAWSAASRAYFRRVSAEIPRGARLRRGAASRTATGHATGAEPHEPVIGRATSAEGDPGVDGRAAETDAVRDASRGPDLARPRASTASGDDMAGGRPGGDTLTRRLRAALDRVRRSVGRVA